MDILSDSRSKPCTYLTETFYAINFWNNRFCNNHNTTVPQSASLEHSFSHCTDMTGTMDQFRCVWRSQTWYLSNWTKNHTVYAGIVIQPPFSVFHFDISSGYKLSSCCACDLFEPCRIISPADLSCFDSPSPKAWSGRSHNLRRKRSFGTGFETSYLVLLRTSSNFGCSRFFIYSSYITNKYKQWVLFISFHHQIQKSPSSQQGWLESIWFYLTICSAGFNKQKGLWTWEHYWIIGNKLNRLHVSKLTPACFPLHSKFLGHSILWS